MHLRTPRCLVQIVSSRLSGTIFSPHLSRFKRPFCPTTDEDDLEGYTFGRYHLHVTLFRSPISPGSAKNHGNFRSNLLVDPSVLVQRRRFAKISGECCVLLSALGVPWVQSPGEAEAMCAMLNSSERVDACITNDGDAFLYGASTVYRHFTMDCRDASVRVYRSCRVREELHFSQRLLVLLGILLGCDYWPTGVAGVGKAGVHRLIGPLRLLSDAELMDLVSWLSTRRSSYDQTVFFTHPFFKDVDPKLRRLYAKVGTEFQNCPVKEILHEFLASPEARLWSLPSAAHVSTWRRPDPRAVVLFCRDHLDWKPDYSLHHLLPVLALWDMRHPQLLKGLLVDDATQLIPIRCVLKYVCFTTHAFEHTISPVLRFFSSLTIRPGAVQNVPELGKVVLTAFNRPAAEQPVRLSTVLAGSRQLESSLLTCSPAVNSFVWSISPVPVESDRCQTTGSRLSLSDDADDSFSAFSTPLRLKDRIAKRIPY
ncbi:hypothetical protein AHF37_02478 [Paragonimus kellicotti]|nr:hypothetical protein AHF37_02478 [Paragonimus kellicotti]